MKVSLLDRRRDPLFDLRSEAGRGLVRTVIGAVLLAVGFSLLMSALARDVAYGAGPPHPTLRAGVETPDAIVTIGDLFEGAGDKAATPLYRAPDLGTTGSVPAREVVTLARTAGLRDAETGGLTEVRVTRLARTVEAEELTRLIGAELMRRNASVFADTAPEDLRVAFSGSLDPLHADLHAEVPVRIADLAYDPQSGRFDVLVLVDEGGSTRKVRLRGEAGETVRVALLTRPLARGDVVGRDDVVIERWPKRRAGGMRAPDPEQLLGLAARRALRPGQPIAQADFVRPVVVKRGDSVLIVFESRALTVTSRGQALESGSVGDLVGVLNPQSKRTVHATVAGPGRVSVGAGATTLASTGSGRNIP